MNENLAGLIKILGIAVLLGVLWAILAVRVPESFLNTGNIENLLRRTALYGILGIGVAFVIISSGIDLSIGSLVCLSACLLAIFLQVDYVHQGAIQTVSIEGSSATVGGPVAESEYPVGSKLWYSVDLRNQKLMTVKQVSGSTISFEEEFGARALNAGETGVLIPVYGIESLNGPRLKLEKPLQGLQVKDKLRFISTNSTTQNQPVVETVDGQTIQLAGELIGVDAKNFYAFRSQRKPLMSIPMAILAVLGIALALGLLHGLLITKLKQRPFIVTLCGLLVYRSISRVLTNDQTVGFGTEYSDTLSAFGEGSLTLWTSAETEAVFGIPYPCFIFLGLIILALIFLNKTIWGRYMMALGRNEEAARYSGINTQRMTILAYVLCAVLAGIGGILFALDANSIAPSSFGNFFELYAIAAAVLGGCSLRGGEGSILGVIVGTALMQTLYNSIVLLRIPDTWEFTIIGVVILIGVTSDELIRRFAGFLKSKSK